ncbi:AAA family ATPase [Granulosicoccus sp.]|nr:AAA family ATPase [Granulosicoccus sp.]
MSDFEKAAARLQQAGHSGMSVDRSELTSRAAEPGAAEESFESLRNLLRKKLNEPLDLLLQADDVPSDCSDPGQDIRGDEGKTVEMLLQARREASYYKKLELPLSSLADRGFITPETPKGRLTEEYRRIKRPLLKQMKGAAAGSLQNVIMVTSSVQGEGKTYSSVNLAISLVAEKNISVLLIDADVYKGTAGRELGSKGDEAGLLDVLAETYSQASEVIMSTNIPDLTFMPAGKAVDNANELLTSTRMRDIIRGLASQSKDQIIIMDCPPILQTNEANSLADHAGQIVFVVAEQQTSQAQVEEAMKYLEKDKFVGMLLNKSTWIGADYSYGYSYLNKQSTAST